MASPVANGASSEANGSGSKATPGHQQGKASFAAKMSENNRKNEEENSQRRNNQPKAWTSGVNPITQRSSPSSHINGAGSRAMNGAEKTPDRQTWMLCNSVGLECTISLKSGDKFTGVFSGSRKSADAQNMAFKMVRDITKDSGRSQLSGHGPEHVMVFPANLIEALEVPEAPAQTRNAPNGTQAGFRTDMDISGNMSVRERDLQRWVAPAGKDVDMSLESSASGQWDQFKANEERFGLKSDYDENIYTTAIDYKNPLYSQRAREAERIAREIEGSAATNAHVREERGLDDGGEDEEEKYSGVRRDQPLQSNQPGRYVPPSRRVDTTNSPASSTPSKPAADAAIDPAIISSQMVKPESSAQPSKSPVTATTQQPALSINTSAPAKEVKPAKQSGKGALATDSVENDVLDSFRQFAANEKIKVQDQKRSRAFQDKAVKLNDLMKFSQNFKLLTPVPKDLVPILAKDESKQKEIVQKAQINAQTKSTKVASVVTDQKSSRPLAAARWENQSTVPGAAPAPGNNSARQAAAQATPSKDRPAAQAVVPQPPQGSLSTRLNNNHQAHRAGLSGAVPAPLPIQDNRNKTPRGAYSSMTSPQKQGNSRGPPSATSLKFNAKAMEFNPNASAFKPGGSVSGTTIAASSPRSIPATRTISPAGPPPSLSGNRRDFSVPGGKDPMTTMLQFPPDPDANGNGSVEVKAASAALKANGGMPRPYATAPTWPVDDPDNGPDHKAVFDVLRPRRHATPQPQPSPNGAMAHQYQLPAHLQQGMPSAPHVQPPHPVQHHPHQQPPHQYSHGPHYEDNHMRPSASQQSYVPSPRMTPQAIGYQSPMPHAAHMAYPQQMQYPQAHVMGPRQFSNPPPMMPVQGGHHLTPMMVPPGQPSFVPQQMGMPFNPQQMPVYAAPNGQQMYGQPGQPPSGYPSPGRGAPMMMHQGSQQGQQPVYMPQPGQFGQPVYAQQPPNMPGMRGGYGSPQPPFAQSPYPQHQQHAFHQQPQRTPSSGYVQPHQPQVQPQPQQQHVQPHQGPPQPTGPTEANEDAK